MSETPIKIQRALISVSDKSCLADFAHALAARGVTIYSTGGTRQFLIENSLQVEDVAVYTGWPEMMDGRVKTLHPKIFGGILARRDHPQDRQALEDHGMAVFDLVVVNLYPFQQTAARLQVADEEVIEQIDIGGPSLVRAAAKNHPFVAIATAAAQYPQIMEQIEQFGGTNLDLRRRLAAEAFAHTAAYDAAIAAWFAATSTEGEQAFPRHLRLDYELREVLRYGENPHQQAAVYAQAGEPRATLLSARKIHGKELSYNNLLDLDAALAIVRDLPHPSAAVIKHNNPCGAAKAADLATAVRRALDGDATSSFGSLIGLNRVVDAATAEVLVEPDRFIEAVIAPAFDPAAIEILTTRPKWKSSVRLLEMGTLAPAQPHWEHRQIDGGVLRQQADDGLETRQQWQVATETAPEARQWTDLDFGYHIVRHVKSNAIVLVNDGMVVGVGAGQMSRVDSVRIAIEKAGDRAVGAALASDAFFPFADSIDLAASARITSIIQPGGSRNDGDVVAAANRHQLSMVLTNRRHFRH